MEGDCRSSISFGKIQGSSCRLPEKPLCPDYVSFSAATPFSVLLLLRGWSEQAQVSIPKEK